MEVSSSILITDSRLQRHREFWSSKLADTSRFVVKPAWYEDSESPSEVEWRSDDKAQAEILRITGGYRSGAFVLGLAAISLTLAKLMQTERVTILTPLSLENEDMLSRYNNHGVVPLVITIGNDWTLREFILAVKDAIEKSYSYQNFPIDGIAQEYHSSSNVFLIMKGVHQFVSKKDHHDLLFDVDFNEVLNIRLSSEIFSSVFLNTCVNAISAFFENLDDSHVNVHSLITSRTSDPLKRVIKNKLTGGSIPDTFQVQVARSPDRLAVVSRTAALSFSEIEELSARLAHAITDGVGSSEKERVIAVCLNKSELTIIALLAVFKSGMVYLPLDPDWPEERIAFVIRDSNASLIVTNRDLQQRLSVLGLDIITAEDALSHPIYTVPPDVLSKYLIYTSGSTGSPKGVLVGGVGFLNMIYSQIHEFKTGSHDHIIFFSSPTFDASLYEIFISLLSGSTLYIPDRETTHDMRALGQFLRTNQISFATLPPSVLNSLEPEDLRDLRIIVSAGEAFKINNHELLDPQRKIYNAYGPTEASVCSSFYLVTSIPGSGRIPIGHPIQNTGIVVVDGSGNLLPTGFPGELCIHGVGLAEGYMNSVELTTQKFVQSSNGTRLYRSGDMGVIIPGGDIQFIGRKDHQLKLRGYRIEPGEIEKLLLEQPGVDDAVVLMKGAAGSNYLCAYVNSSVLENPEGLRSRLHAVLPSYMVPSRYVILNNFPLTSHGKVNRAALMEIGDEYVDTYVAPATELEQSLHRIWENILEREKISVTSSFFDLGGHSLNAFRLVSHIHRDLAYIIDLRSVFKYNTIRSQAEMLKAKSQSAYSNIAAIEDQDHYVLSHAQRRLWVLEQIGNDHAAYSMPIMFRFYGELHIDILEATLIELTDRHEILRTRLVVVDGHPRQRVEEHVDSFNIRLLDIRGKVDKEKHLSLIFQEEIRRVFNLESGPLLRLIAVRAGEEDWHVIFNMHHVISDESSMETFARELSIIYNAKVQKTAHSLSKIQSQYRDYCAAQRTLLSGVELLEHQRYWWKKLSGDLPVTEVSGDYSRPAVKTYDGAIQGISLSETDVKGLLSISSAAGATLFMSVTTVLKILLYRYTRQKDILLGTVTSGRDHGDLENQLGVYINLVALRTQIDGDLPYNDLLYTVRETCLEAYKYAAYPFDALVEDLKLSRDLSRSPLFDILAIYHKSQSVAPAAEFTGLVSEVHNSEGVVSKYDLTFNFIETSDGLELSIEYNTNIYRKETIARVCDHFRELVRSVVESKGQTTVDQLDYVDHIEREFVLKSLQGIHHPTTMVTIQSLVEDRAATSTYVRAVEFEERSFTYGELNSLSNRLGRFIREKYNIRRDDRVAIIMMRSERMVISILGVLKSGACYVPIDPRYPPDRIAYMLSDAGVSVVITDCDFHHKSIAVIDWQSDWISEPDDKLTDINEPSDLAYVIYTSGSTGRPKGVMIEHRNFINFNEGMLRSLNVSTRPHLLAVTPTTFDISVLELLWTLINGIKITINPTGQASGLDSYADKKINILQTTPTLLNLILTDSGSATFISKLDTIVVGGEALKQELLNRLLTKTKADIYNVYGPTETTIWSTVAKIDRSAPAIDLGNPILNTTISIDRDGRLQGVGVSGEIVISGSGVARGYLNNPELTHELFKMNADGQRAYSTGDVGRVNVFGKLEYLSRADHQVKIHGHRVETGEIEKQLLLMEGIEDCVVLKREDYISGYLCGYVLSKAYFKVSTLREYLALSLPQYMIPARFVVLTEFPLTPHGKVDRKRLPEPESISLREYETVMPRNSFEQAIADVWTEVLNVSGIGVNDNFFDLGGDSVKAIRAVLKINERIKATFNLSEIFVRPTISAISMQCEASSTDLLIPLNISNPKNSPKIVFVPPILGSSLIYLKLFQAIKSKYNFYGLQNKGFDQPGLLHTSIEEMAADFNEEVKQIDPCNEVTLIGFSMGAIVAYEMAKQLEKTGARVNLVVMECGVDMCSDLSNEKVFEDAQLSYRREIGNLLAMHNLGNAKRFETLVLNNLDMLRKYSFSGSIQGPIAVLGGADQDKAALDKWADFTKSEFRSVEISGTHHEIFETEHIGSTAQQLEYALTEIEKFWA